MSDWHMWAPAHWLDTFRKGSLTVTMVGMGRLVVENPPDRTMIAADLFGRGSFEVDGDEVTIVSGLTYKILGWSPADKALLLERV